MISHKDRLIAGGSFIAAIRFVTILACYNGGIFQNRFCGLRSVYPSAWQEPSSPEAWKSALRTKRCLLAIHKRLRGILVRKIEGFKPLFDVSGKVCTDGKINFRIHANRRFVSL